MTCIVGVTESGRVWLGGDSAAVSGWNLRIRADPKVCRVGDFQIGFTTSFRMGQLLAHTFTPPDRPAGKDSFAYMVADVVPALRRCFEAGGWAETKDGKHNGGTFLIGYNGRLFQIADDFQVAETVDGFDAVGCGAEVALGALFAMPDKSPADRVLTALQAAEAMSAGVRGPFVVLRP